VAGFDKRAAASKAKGKLRGMGLSTWIEACGIAPSNLVGVLGSRVGLYDAATVRVNATGNISVMTGAHSHGQGHETVFAQIVAEKLGIPESSIEIVHGDTSKIPFGMGSYGSRSLAVCGTAMTKAVDKIIAKGKKIAAHMLEASKTTSPLRMASSASPAPTRRRASAKSPSRPMSRTTTRWKRWNRGWRKPPSTIRPTSPIPQAPISARWRLTPKPARSTSPPSPAPTTSAM
jgi:CO/xanthine dehydrogenase Mo-binding subunit